MSFNLEALSAVIGDRLKDIGSAETIMGDPIEIDGKTIIPVIRLKLGFGIGGGEDKSAEASGKHGCGGNGGGGGGGIAVEPAAFITIIGDEITVLSPKGARFEKLTEAVPSIIEKIIDIKDKKQKSEKPEEAPSEE